METNSGKRGRGRPRKEGSRNRQIRIRVTDEELISLEDVSYETGISVSDLLRIGMKMVYNQNKYGELLWDGKRKSNDLM